MTNCIHLGEKIEQVTGCGCSNPPWIYQCNCEQNEQGKCVTSPLTFRGTAKHGNIQVCGSRRCKWVEYPVEIEKPRGKIVQVDEVATTDGQQPYRSRFRDAKSQPLADKFTPPIPYRSKFRPPAKE